MSDKYYDVSKDIWKNYVKNPLLQLAKTWQFILYFCCSVVMLAFSILLLANTNFKAPISTVMTLFYVIFLGFYALVIVFTHNFAVKNKKTKDPIIKILKKYEICNSEQISLLIEDGKELKRLNENKHNFILKILGVLWITIFLGVIFAFLPTFFSKLIKLGDFKSLYNILIGTLQITLSMTAIFVTIYLFIHDIFEYKYNLTLNKLYMANYEILRTK